MRAWWICFFYVLGTFSLFAKDFSKEEFWRQYILGLRNPSLAKRRLVLRDLARLLGELRLRSRWIHRRDYERPREVLGRLQGHVELLRALEGALRYSDLRGDALRCLGAIGGFSSARIIYRNIGREGLRESLQALIEIGEDAQIFLVLLMLSDRALHREEEILEILARRPDPRVLPYLLFLLKRRTFRLPEAFQRVMLAYGKRVLPFLDRFIRSQVPPVSLRAILILGRMRMPEAVLLLKKHYRRAKSTLEKGVILQAIGESGCVEGEEFLLHQLEEVGKDSRLAASILYALGFGRLSSSARVLLDVVYRRHPLGGDFLCYRYALRALGMRRERGAWDAFVRALESRRKAEVFEGVVGISRLDHPRRWEYLSRVYWRTSYEDIRLFCLRSLWRLEHPGKVIFLKEAYRKERSGRVRLLLLGYLRRYPSAQVDRWMGEALWDEFPEARRIARDYLERRSIRLGKPLLSEAVFRGLGFSKEGIVQENLDFLLGTRAPLYLPERWRGLFLEKMRSGSERLRQTLVELAGRLSLGEALPLLVQVVEGGRGSSVLRRGALESIGRIGDERAFNFLRKLVVLEDHPLRREAILALGWVQREGVLSLLRDLFRRPFLREAVVGALLRQRGEGARRFLEGILLNRDYGRSLQLPIVRQFWEDPPEQLRAYKLLEGSIYAQMLGCRILMRRLDVVNVSLVRELYRRRPTEPLRQLLVHIRLREASGRFLRTSRGQSAVKFWLDWRRKGAKEGFGVLCKYVFDLEARRYLKRREVYLTLRKRTRGWRLSGLNFLTLKEFERISLAFAHTVLPSELTGEEVVVFPSGERHCLILKRVDSGEWRIWGGR